MSLQHSYLESGSGFPEGQRIRQKLDMDLAPWVRLCFQRPSLQSHLGLTLVEKLFPLPASFWCSGKPLTHKACFLSSRLMAFPLVQKSGEDDKGRSGPGDWG